MVCLMMVQSHYAKYRVSIPRCRNLGHPQAEESPKMAFETKLAARSVDPDELAEAQVDNQGRSPKVDDHAWSPT